MEENYEDSNDLAEKKTSVLKRILIKGIMYLGTIISGATGLAYFVQRNKNEYEILGQEQFPIETTLKYEQEKEKLLYPKIKQVVNRDKNVTRGFATSNYYNGSKVSNILSINKHNEYANRRMR